MKQTFIEQIESKLTTLEAEAAEQAVSSATMKKNTNEVKKFIENSVKLAETMGEPFTEEEKNSFLGRIESLSQKSYKIGYMSPRAKKLIAVAAMTLVIGGTGGVAMVSMHGCGSSDEPEKIASTQTTETEMPEVTQPTTMDVRYQEMSEEIVTSMNDAISKGFEVTEENKFNMSKMYTEYYMLNQMDSLTDEEWANIFQNSTITARDLMNSKESLEWIDEQRVTVADKDMMLDYSHMFSGADLKLLTDAADLLDKVKTTTGKERKEAEANFKQYVLDNLNSENIRMQYSERALDTFRAVYFDAFDTLTGGKAIDDELEHAINTTIACSLSDTPLDVEDKTITSLQSDYQTYLLEKLEVRLQNGWVYVSNNEVNPYNDINEISKYVSENIDLSLYRELPDYEETLTEMFAPKGGAEKSKNDSGVSNGNGGIISNEQFDEYGINPSSPTAKEELEQKVEEETKKQEEESTRVTDENGNTLQGTAQDNINGFNAGYSAAMNGQPKPAYTGNQSYDTGIDSGWSLGTIDKQAAENSVNNNVESEYVPVDNGQTTTTESEIKTETYTDSNTGDASNSSESLESSETVSDEDRFIEEETTFVPIAKRIEELNAFKDSLQKYIIPEEQGISRTYSA